MSARKYRFEAYSNDVIDGLIKKWIHHARNRKIAKMFYIDGRPAEAIASKIGLSDKRVYEIARECGEIIDAHKPPLADAPAQ